ncbi:endonuclease domain-containing protein [Dryocola clanedunensis]|uniref:endonuclease domain-containing protein n=1 Tax=Cedecea sulfonylureivorans TaxID=3051154 RepID=UPI0019285D6D|nr:DUF559 domain-containing protein [Cedecea sulfonylureivorans]
MDREHIKALRQNMTPEERILWKSLRNRQFAEFKFRRQHPLRPFIVDFACLEAKLIVELDGGQHDENRRYDEERRRWLEKRGWKVLRFWNNEFRANQEGVLMEILASLNARSIPSPGGEG